MLLGRSAGAGGHWRFYGDDFVLALLPNVAENLQRMSFNQSLFVLPLLQTTYTNLKLAQVVCKSIPWRTKSNWKFKANMSYVDEGNVLFCNHMALDRSA